MDSLWTGPDGKGANGGVTQGLIAKFLACRDRFRVLTFEGLRPLDRFSHYLEFGSMWHVCEQAAAEGKSLPEINAELIGYTRKLCEKYRFDQELVVHWYNVCRVQFPIYLEYWRGTKPPGDVVLAEEAFDVNYLLPSGRNVRLRGRWDAILMCGAEEGDPYLVVQDNKTKGDIDRYEIERRLTYDLQTMVYAVALRHHAANSLPITSGLPVGGVLYNVIRRPLSGGTGSIRQHKPTKSNPNGESTDAFFERLGGVIEDGKDTFFARWLLPLSEGDITKFTEDCMHPILESMCNWWEMMNAPGGDLPGTVEQHWRMPYGVYGVDGGGPVDDYLNTGSSTGLQKTEMLFPELVDG